RPGRALHAAGPRGVRHRPGLGPQGDGSLIGANADGIALEARDLRKAFGGIRAVDGCSFAVPRGKISGLIGPNGSGKTTTFNLLTGLATPDSGEVIYRGENLAGLKPYQFCRKGVTRTFPVTRTVRALTVPGSLLSVSGLAVRDRVARG